MEATHQPTADRLLGDIVSDDLRTAAIFERFGLDYCCNGQRTLREACQARSIPAADVVAALDGLGVPTEDDRLPAEWHALDALTRHIVQHHHHYVTTSIPAINQSLDKLVSVHGDRHPELRDLRAVFRSLGDELLTHLQKEENLLFPAIDEMARAQRGDTSAGPGMFATVLHPVRVMEEDHHEAGQMLARLRDLSGGNFEPPADACNTYRACFAELRRFEDDLHRHIHLENNVLFPRALDLERTLG